MILTDVEICTIYAQAVHGNGAAERWAARDMIQDHLRECGISMSPLFSRLGLSISAYFASRPISSATMVAREKVA